jgi:hypothetical protein
MRVSTMQCASNIAVIKYWGKRDEKLLLPINSSLSVTLSPIHMGTTTTAAASPEWEGDRLWLNGKEEDVNSERVQNCLKAIRSRAGKDAPVGGVRIVSENNFPTAAGLASSASGYACLVAALGSLYNVEGDISSIARQVSMCWVEHSPGHPSHPLMAGLRERVQEYARRVRQMGHGSPGRRHRQLRAPARFGIPLAGAQRSHPVRPCTARSPCTQPETVAGGPLGRRTTSRHDQACGARSRERAHPWRARAGWRATRRRR